MCASDPFLQKHHSARILLTLYNRASAVCSCGPTRAKTLDGIPHMCECNANPMSVRCSRQLQQTVAAAGSYCDRQLADSSVTKNDKINYGS